MLRTRIIAPSVWIAAITLLVICESALADNGYGSYRRGTWTFGFAGHTYGTIPPAQPTSNPTKRYYDSTGRWTGDGVDTMATNPSNRPRLFGSRKNCSY